MNWSLLYTVTCYRMSLLSLCCLINVSLSTATYLCQLSVYNCLHFPIMHSSFLPNVYNYDNSIQTSYISVFLIGRISNIFLPHAYMWSSLYFLHFIYSNFSFFCSTISVFFLHFYPNLSLLLLFILFISLTHSVILFFVTISSV